MMSAGERDFPGGRADAALEAEAAHSRSGADIALFERAFSGIRQRGKGMLL